MDGGGTPPPFPGRQTRGASTFPLLLWREQISVIIIKKLNDYELKFINFKSKSNKNNL
jgi:hypothetical protein